MNDRINDDTNPNKDDDNSSIIILVIIIMTIIRRTAIMIIIITATRESRKKISPFFPIMLHASCFPLPLPVPFSHLQSFKNIPKSTSPPPHFQPYIHFPPLPLKPHSSFALVPLSSLKPSFPSPFPLEVCFPFPFLSLPPSPFFHLPFPSSLSLSPLSSPLSSPFLFNHPLR